MTRLPAFLALLLLACGAAAIAAEPASTAVPPSSSSLLQVLFGLVVVLALMGGAAWALKRMGVAGTAAANVARVIGGVSVGNRERVVVVEVADQWIVVGVAPGRVNALSTMPRQDLPASVQQGPVQKNFSDWLKQTLDKRNGA